MGLFYWSEEKVEKVYREGTAAFEEKNYAAALKLLTKAAERIGGATYDLYTPLLSIAVIYFVLVFGMTRLLKLFERRLARSDNR